MMSFYSSPCYAAPAGGSLTSLFRLLDDFEHYQQQLKEKESQHQNPNAGATQPRRKTRPLPTFQPRFDVRETENAYVLHGELAGLERENVEVEFTEPQTMVIRGRIERSYEKKLEQEQQQQQPEAEAAAAEMTDEDKNQKRRNSHQATVEDDPEEPSTPVHTPPESPKTKPADKPADKQQQVQKAAAPQPPRVRVLATERSVGEFSRAFSFPVRVDHDGVTASLDSGILTVTVPKAKKHEVRRIAVHW